MKKLVAGSLATGAMVLFGGMVMPVHAQGSSSSTPSPAPAAPGSVQPTRAQQLMGDMAPKLAKLTDNVLFGDVWQRPGLSKRDRSLVTVSALVAMNRPDQLRSHLALARENGLIPTRADHHALDALAQSRRPMDMMIQGWSMRQFQASQQ